MTFLSVDPRVDGTEPSEYWSLSDDGFDPAVSNGLHDCAGRESVDVESRREPPDLERKVCVAAADDWEVTFAGDLFDCPTVFGVLAVHLDGVDRGVALAERAVAERMGNNRDAVVVVCERDRLVGREFARGGVARRVRPDDQQVPLCRRDFDTRNAGVADDGFGAEEIVIRDRDTVETATSGETQCRPDAVAVVAGRELRATVEEPAVGVEVAVEHEFTRTAPPSDINSRGMVPHDRPDGTNMSGGNQRWTMAEPTRVVVRNPNSGDGKRTNRARKLATDRGWEVLDSQGGEHTVELASEAAERADTVVACGGDGTLNKTVNGVLAAGELDTVSLGVIPAGTGNDFADNVGIHGVEHAFRVIESGECRNLDLGMVNGRPFLNSCVGGLTAESSAKTSRTLKRRVGVLAYVLTTLSVARDFESLSLGVSVGPDRDPTWAGEALMLLVGNGRRFPGERMHQANMEDGCVNVVIIKDAPTLDYLATGAADRLLRRKASHLVRVKSSHLHVTNDGGPVQFSLDGEMIETDELNIDSRAGAMRFFVGEGYDPSPEEWSETTPK